jgi:hypothetical protein
MLQRRESRGEGVSGVPRLVAAGACRGPLGTAAAAPRRDRGQAPKHRAALTSATAARSFQPEPKFKRVQPEHALADFSGVEGGSCELWLIQLPRGVQLDAIESTEISVVEEGGKQVVKGTIACAAAGAQRPGAALCSRRHTAREPAAERICAAIYAPALPWRRHGAWAVAA